MHKLLNLLLASFSWLMRVLLLICSFIALSLRPSKTVLENCASLHRRFSTTFGMHRMRCLKCKTRRINCANNEMKRTPRLSFSSKIANGKMLCRENKRERKKRGALKNKRCKKHTEQTVCQKRKVNASKTNGNCASVRCKRE